MFSVIVWDSSVLVSAAGVRLSLVIILVQPSKAELHYCN